MTTEPTLTVLEDPDAAIREEILRPLVAYNASKVGVVTPRPAAIILRHDVNAEIIGGLWAISVYDWLYIDLLFVPADLRSRGLGSSLLTLAEQIAADRGCIGVRLDTYSFQAPGFYEKLGYIEYGRLADHPRGHERIYYYKRLDTPAGSAE
jgi:GNAT superfamily N-acetyltransferase